MTKVFWFKNSSGGKLVMLPKNTRGFFYPATLFELHLKFGSNAGGIAIDFEKEPAAILLLDDICVCEQNGGVFCKILWKDKIGYINLYHFDRSSRELIYDQIDELVRQKITL